MSVNILKHKRQRKQTIIKTTLLCLVSFVSLYILIVLFIMDGQTAQNSTSSAKMQDVEDAKSGNIFQQQYSSDQSLKSQNNGVLQKGPNRENKENGNSSNEEAESREFKREDSLHGTKIITMEKQFRQTGLTTPKVIQISIKTTTPPSTTTTTTEKNQKKNTDVGTSATANTVNNLQLDKLIQHVKNYSSCIVYSIENVVEELSKNSFDDFEELLRRHCFLKLFGKYSGSSCTWPPRKLVGPLQVDFSPPTELDSVLTHVKEGGRWSPKHCTPRQEVAIIIPFRDRHSHLSVFLLQIHGILKRQEYAYRIIVIEQLDEYPFNRGKLMNVGYREALNISSSFTCFVFHDVDLVPENDRNDYGCPTSPRHLSHAVDKFDYKLPYPGIFGGVEAFLKQDFERINGFSNSYWGWGAEDDDLYKRITQNGFSITRPSITEGRYKMIKHVSSRDAPPNRHDKLNHAHETYQTDGISTLQYKVLDIKIHTLYTLIQVDLNIEEDSIY